MHGRARAAGSRGEDGTRLDCGVLQPWPKPITHAPWSLPSPCALLSGLEHGAVRDEADFEAEPQGDGEFAGHGDDGAALGASLLRADALAEPEAECALGPVVNKASMPLKAVSLTILSGKAVREPGNRLFLLNSTATRQRSGPSSIPPAKRVAQGRSSVSHGLVGERKANRNPPIAKPHTSLTGEPMHESRHAYRFRSMTH